MVALRALVAAVACVLMVVHSFSFQLGTHARCQHTSPASCPSVIVLAVANRMGITVAQVEYALLPCCCRCLRRSVLLCSTRWRTCSTPCPVQQMGPQSGTGRERSPCSWTAETRHYQEVDRGHSKPPRSRPNFLGCLRRLCLVMRAWHGNVGNSLLLHYHSAHHGTCGRTQHHLMSSLCTLNQCARLRPPDCPAGGLHWYLIFPLQRV
jgi:hypothetical protein